LACSEPAPSPVNPIALRRVGRLRGDAYEDAGQGTALIRRQRMRRTIQLAAIAGAVLAIAGCGGSSSSNSSSSSSAPAASGGSGGNALSATVGPGFTISMDKTSVPAGTYTLTVDDQS